MLLRILFLLIFAFATLAAQADIKESDDWLVKRREHRALSTLSENFGTPDTILPDKVAVAIIDFNFVSCDILIVGPISGNAKAYAQLLDDWQRAQSLNKTVYYSQEDDCAAARLIISNSKFGAKSGSLSIDLPSLVSKINQVEQTVHPVLRAGKGTIIDPGKPADFTSPTNQNYWLLKGLSGNLEAVTSTVELPPEMLLVIALWFGLPPFGILLGFGLGYLVLKRSQETAAKKSKLFSRIALGFTFGSIGLHAMLVMGTLFNGALNPISYLWFGTRFSAAAIVPVMIGPLLAMFALPWLNKLEKKAIEKAPESPEELITQQKTEAVFKEIETKSRAELKAHRKKWLPFTIPVVLIGFVLSTATFLPKDHALRRISPLGLPIMMIGILGPTFAMTRAKREPNPLEDGNLLTQVRYEMAPIADRLGLSMPQILMQSSSLFGASSLHKRGKNIELGEQFLDAITAPERNFVYAVELSKIKYREISLFTLTIPFVFVLQAPLFYMMFGLPYGSPLKAKIAPFAFGFMVVGMFGLHFLLRKYRDSQAAKHDRIAVDIVGKTVALSALKQLALPIPELRLGQNLADDIRDHPILGKRYQTIEKMED